MDSNSPKSNAGLWAALAGMAAVGGVVAAAAIGGKKSSSGGGLHGASGSGARARRFVKKPCGCGR